jgi:twitching motility protein PilU
MKVKPYLKHLAEHDGSDIYFSTGAIPKAKFLGRFKALGKETFPPGYVKQLADELMTDEQREEFSKRPEMNMALSLPNIGRFRVNIFKQRGEVAMVIRYIKSEIPNFEALGLPPVLKKVAMANRGLVLFIGGTGMGKSTSLACMIDHRNANSEGHIITIEDPIEFIHRHKNCIVNQREIGMDTESWEDAMENAMRQSPDAILIGEIRNRETMEHALAFAESGHLTLATIHANNANQALDRIINFFPGDKHRALLQDLSLNMRAFVSQRLISTLDKKRCAAFEVLLNSPRIAELIRENDIMEIKELMKKSEHVGMQTFDMDLYRLYKDGEISRDAALSNADSENDLGLKMGLDGGANSSSQSSNDSSSGLDDLDDLVFQDNK